MRRNRPYGSLIHVAKIFTKVKSEAETNEQSVSPIVKARIVRRRRGFVMDIAQPAGLHV